MTASEPDVSVVVAVYDTMPHLTECLTSLVDQTIGTERLEVVAVDDGSTDGSSDELDRFAARFPGVVTVVHQQNSGGPAAPSNRALDLARGRYVLFVGADDHLALDALELLVERADVLGSDVMIGRMVGVNDRYVHQELYREARDSITFEDSALAWTLSNTKLFRRSLVEKHAIRFPEDLAVGSDQPFTIEACLRASRISVLGDHVCYYAVRREHAQNITYRSRPEVRLMCATRIMERVADWVPPGSLRDAILVRHFNWELSKLVENDLPALSEEGGDELREAVTELVDRYWTPAIRDRSPVGRRVIMELLRLRARPTLDRLLADRAAEVRPPLVFGSGRTFAALPGFRDPELGLDDGVYQLIEEDASAYVGGTLTPRPARVTRAGRHGGTLHVAAGWAVRAGSGDPPVAVVATADRRMPESSDRHAARRLPADREVAGSPTEVAVPADADVEVVAEVALLPLVREVTDTTKTWGLRFYPRIAGRTYELPVPADGATVRRTVWDGTRPYEVSVCPNDRGRLVLRISPLSVPRALFGRRR